MCFSDIWLKLNHHKYQHPSTSLFINIFPAEYYDYVRFYTCHNTLDNALVCVGELIKATSGEIIYLSW